MALRSYQELLSRVLLSLPVRNVLNPAAFGLPGMGIPGTSTDPNHSGIPGGVWGFLLSKQSVALKSSLAVGITESQTGLGWEGP